MCWPMYGHSQLSPVDNHKEESHESNKRPLPHTGIQGMEDQHHVGDEEGET